MRGPFPGPDGHNGAVRGLLALTVVTLTFGVAVHSAVAQQAAVQIDYMFLIDISGSMAGVGGTKAVFDDVRAAVKEFARQLETGTTVVVLPFDAEVRDRRHFVLTDQSARGRFESYVDSLQANGQRTGVYRSIAEAVKQGNLLRANNQARVIVVNVYTDGADNVSREWSLRHILEHFNVHRGANDWLYYTELGVRPDPQKAAMFKEYDRMRYVQTSEVRPIIQIHALLPVLDFGNIKGSSPPKRVQKYSVKSTDSLPAGLKLTAQSHFPDLVNKGVFVSIVPLTHEPADSVTWELRVDNTQSLPDGRYSGEISLQSSDAAVIVVPNRVRAIFAYEDAHTFTVGTPQGVTGQDLDLGTVADQADVVEIDIPVEFSRTAAAANDDVLVELVHDPESAGPLVPEALRVAPSGRIPVSTKRLRIAVHPIGRLARGEYRGELRFRSTAARIEGQILRDGANGTKVLPWRFSAPTPWWVWPVLLSGLLMMGGAVAWRRTRPATFPDLMIEVLEPDRQTIDLAGQVRVALGDGQQLLPKAPGSIELIPQRSGRSVRAIARPVGGQWQIKRPGVKDEMMLIAEEPVFHGDVLRNQGYRLRLSSFSLIRTDAEE